MDSHWRKIGTYGTNYIFLLKIFIIIKVYKIYTYILIYRIKLRSNRL